MKTESIWDIARLNETPRTYSVDFPASNWIDDVPDVKKIFIEGEPYHGKPTRIFAWVGLPKGASPTDKVPAMVLVHGGGGTAFAYWVKIWNKRGYAAIAMDTCGKCPKGEYDGEPHFEHAWSGPPGWAGSAGQTAEPVKDQWTYHAVAAVMRCHSYLRSLPEVDPERIGLTGVSWGGYLACIVGSVDSRFRFAAPIYGCGHYELNHEWREAMGKDPEAFRFWLDTWDAGIFLKKNSGVPFHWFCGTTDRWYALDAVKASCEDIPKAVSCALTLKNPMEHGHPLREGGTDSGDPRELAALADAYLKDGLPLVEVTSADVAGNKLSVTFNAHGREVVRAELLWTESTDEILCRREWKSTDVAQLDVNLGRLTVQVPSNAAMYFVSIIDADGYIVSSPISSNESRYDVAAYIWPAYQPEPRWKELGVFDAGKGEWQNVWEAVPKWEGHRQPLVPIWGYENEANPEVVEKKIETAVSHGVNVFIYDWYWYEGRPFLEDAINKGFLGAGNNGKMKFFIMWANHNVNLLWNNKEADKHWDRPIWRGGADKDDFKKIVARWIELYFIRPNYYRIGGKPVVMIYEIGTFVERIGGIDAAKEAIAYLRDECAKAGLGGIHLMACDFGLSSGQVEALDVDSATIYNFIHWSSAFGNPDYAEWTAKAAKRFDEAKRTLGTKMYFAHASVGWDTNPRYPVESVQPTVMDSTPDKFEVALRRAKEWTDCNAAPGAPRLITVNSWNEWTEGSYLEPDTVLGYGYLNAVRNVFGV